MAKMKLFCRPESVSGSRIKFAATVVFYFFTLLFLSFFSFSQVDAGLHLFSNKDDRLLQNSLVRFASEKRLYTGLIYTFLFIGMFVAYFLLMKQWKRISKRVLAVFIIGTVALTFFAFPASFSHDIYNYLMYEKILLVYHANPYTVLPAHFRGDPLLNYIHWPNAPSRYGPVWLALAGVVYFFTQNSLAVSLWGVKALLVACFLGTLIVVVKIARHLRVDVCRTLIFIVGNPLIIVESLINPHVDSLMTFLAVAAVWFVLKRRNLKAGVLIMMSFLSKAVSLPVSLILIVRSVRLFFWIALIGAVVESVVLSIAAWYFVLPVIAAAFLYASKKIRYLVYALSAATLVRYLPYFYLGYFDPTNKIRLILFVFVMILFTAWSFRSDL
ncbi:hypothetical protein HY214_04135 [Candidatus Roizmanbacteria bacterium]|nr:hypothetical protein [Candidatus Roizmanbacteria bacterium]